MLNLPATRRLWNLVFPPGLNDRLFGLRTLRLCWWSSVTNVALLSKVFDPVEPRTRNTNRDVPLTAGRNPVAKPGDTAAPSNTAFAQRPSEGTGTPYFAKSPAHALSCPPNANNPPDIVRKRN